MSEQLSRVLEEAAQGLQNETIKNAIPIAEFLRNERMVRDAATHPFQHLVNTLEGLGNAYPEHEQALMGVLYPGATPPNVPVGELFDTQYVVAQLIGTLRQILTTKSRLRPLVYLEGPPGCGKSTLLEFLVSLLDKCFTYQIEGCPNGDSPLYALPVEVQENIANALSAPLLTGRLCSVCAERSCAELTVQRVGLGRLAWCAAVQFGTDPKNNRKALLSALASGHGALIQVDQLPEAIDQLVGLLHAVLAGEGYVPEGVSGRISREPAIIASGNVDVLTRLDKAHREPMHQRTAVVKVPMMLRFSKQFAALRAAYGNNEIVSASPRMLEVIAALATLSRYTASGNETVPPLHRLALYEGQVHFRGGFDARRTMWETVSDHPGDGMDGEKSLSPRQAETLAAAAIASCDRGSWLPWELIDRIEGRGQPSIFPAKSFGTQTLDAARTVTWALVLFDALEAFAPGEVARRTDELVALYVRHVKAIQGVQDDDPEFVADKKLLEEVEGAVGIHGRKVTHQGHEVVPSEVFRNLVTPRLSELRRNGGHVPAATPVLRHAAHARAIELERERLMKLLSGETADSAVAQEQRELRERLAGRGYPESVFPRFVALLKKHCGTPLTFVPFPLD